MSCSVIIGEVFSCCRWEHMQRSITGQGTGCLYQILPKVLREREMCGRGNGKIVRNDNDGRPQGNMALEIQKDWQLNELM